MSEAYLLIGFLLFLAYVLIKLVVEPPETVQIDERRISNAYERHLLLFEYRTLNEEVSRRGEMLAIHGSIFVVASLALLGATVSAASIPRPARVALVFLALLVYATWLLVVTCTSQRLDDITFARLIGIEERLRFEVHRYVRERAGRWWLVIRRFIWGFVLILIWLGGYFLLLKM